MNTILSYLEDNPVMHICVYTTVMSYSTKQDLWSQVQSFYQTYFVFFLSALLATLKLMSTSNGTTAKLALRASR